MPLTDPKYIVLRFGSEEMMVTFPAQMIHRDVAMALRGVLTRQTDWLGVPVSAGFISGGKCCGESESLGIKSRGDVDDRMLAGIMVREAERPVPTGGVR